jgi:hypothetical protein
MALAKPQRSLKAWGDQKWTTKSGKTVVRNRRAVPAKKSNTSAKPTGVRSNNQSKTSGKSAGKTVRAPAVKNKTKSKAVPKG